MKTINSIVLKRDAETVQSGASAVAAIAILLRDNAIEEADADGRPFLDGYTQGGLVAALDLIATNLSYSGERLAGLMGGER